MIAASTQTGRFRPNLTSPLSGVPDTAWARFVAALEVQSMRAVSESGGLGSYDIRPRRLVELGYATNLCTTRTDAGRQVHTCDFLQPWTEERFLADPMAQYKALAKSISLYHKSLTSGQVQKPEGMSLAGALAVLHRGGRGALGAWPNLFEQTRALYRAAQGAF